MFFVLLRNWSTLVQMEMQTEHFICSTANKTLCGQQLLTIVLCTYSLLLVWENTIAFLNICHVSLCCLINSCPVDSVKIFFKTKDSLFSFLLRLSTCKHTNPTVGNPWVSEVFKQHNTRTAQTVQTGPQTCSWAQIEPTQWMY